MSVDVFLVVTETVCSTENHKGLKLEFDFFFAMFIMWFVTSSTRQMLVYIKLATETFSIYRFLDRIKLFAKNYMCMLLITIGKLKRISKKKPFSKTRVFLRFECRIHVYVYIRTQISK